MSFLNTHISSSEVASAPVWRLLLRFSLPALVATCATSLYNLTDSIFIGQGIGPMAMVAVGVVLPIMNVVSAFGAMIGVGAASLVAMRMGKGKQQRACGVLNTICWMNVALAVVVAVLGLLFLDPILTLFGATEGEVLNGVYVEGSLDYARKYLKILLLGNIVTNMYLSLNEVMRVSGYPRKAMSIMLLAVALNVVLDAVFIFLLRWGIEGLACATLVAQGVAFVLELLHFSKSSNAIHFSGGAFAPDYRNAWRILLIGSATFMTHFLTSIVVYFVNNALVAYGDLYIGAYSVVNRVMMLFIMIVVGFNRGMQPIVGYNYGAKRFDRVYRTLFFTMLCGGVAMLMGFLLCELYPDGVASLFVNADMGNALMQAQSDALREMIATALRIVFVVTPIVGVQIVITHFFQYIGKSHLSIALTLVRQIVFLIPLLLILPTYYGAKGVWMSMPIADGVASLLAMGVLFVFWRRNA